MFMSRRSSHILAICTLAVLALGACAPKTAVDAVAIDVPLRGVVSRHDQYVLNDPKLTDVEKKTYLRSSEILISIQEAALHPPQ